MSYFSGLSPIVNGYANNGTDGWETENVSVIKIDNKNYFHVQGYMKQTVDISDWIIGVDQISLSFRASVQDDTQDHLVDSFIQMVIHFGDVIEISHVNIENTTMMTSDAIHSISKRRATSIDVVVKGRNLLITDLILEKSFGVNEETVDYVQSQMPIYLYAVNNASLSIGIIQQYPIRVIIENEKSTNLSIGLLAIGQASVAMTLGIKILLGGERINPEINHFCPTGWNTINANFLVPQIQPGSRFLDIQISTNIGEFSIPAESLRLFVLGANLRGGISPEAPYVNWEEKIPKIVINTKNILHALQEPVPSPVISQPISKQVITTEAFVELV